MVPKPSMPAGGSGARTYSASAWVGIDGSTCQSAILQTGVDFSARGGAVTYEGWYEWYPDYVSNELLEYARNLSVNSPDCASARCIP